MIIWIIGLSGSGKSTIAQAVYEQWKAADPATVLADGDHIRAVMGNNTEETYTLEGRAQNSLRMAGLCRWLDSQDINVICPVLSIFSAHRQELRKQTGRYFEVYVQRPLERVVEDDSKGLYRAFREGRTRHVVGMDIPFPEPETPDMVVANEPFVDVSQTARSILQACGAFAA